MKERESERTSLEQVFDVCMHLKKYERTMDVLFMQRDCEWCSHVPPVQCVLEASL